MGETVTKVLVDGEFFGDDPGMAVKFYVPMPSKKYKFLIKKKRPS
jgi:hypothetical protein